MAEDRDY